MSPTGATDENPESNPDVGADSGKKQEESYYEEMLHFLPSLVDISAVQTPIISVAGGNQHSLILSGKPDSLPWG